MKPERLLRAILPDVLIDNFDIVNFDKSADRFDIYLDEKKVQLKEDSRTHPCPCVGQQGGGHVDG